MHALRLLGPLLLLAACQATPPVASSEYVCPDGRRVRAGLTPDHRLLVLLADGGRHTLRRHGDGATYGNGRYLVQMDDLFLRLGIAGTLLPQQCRLLPGPARPSATPAPSP
jgi:hypothetical protein